MHRDSEIGKYPFLGIQGTSLEKVPADKPLHEFLGYCKPVGHLLWGKATT